MTWLKKILARLLPSSPPKSETVSPPTDPLSLAVSESWSHAFLENVMGENVFARMLKENENLRGVPERLRDRPASEELSPASGIRIAAPPSAPPSGSARSDSGTTTKESNFGPEEYTRANFQKVVEDELRKQYGTRVTIKWLDESRVRPEVPDPSASLRVTPSASANLPGAAMTSKAGADYVRGETTYFRSIEDLVRFAPVKTTALTGGGRLEEAADKFGPYEKRFDRKDRLRSFTRTERLKEVFGKPIAETKIWIYDPQADEPLEKDSEEYMFEQVATYGAESYFTTLCERHGVTPQPWPPSEHEFVRAIRKLVRGLKIYEGEKFIQ